MLKTLHYEFGKISIFDKFVVVVIDEGINVIPEYNDILVKIAEDYYFGRCFGYITYRRNSYSVNPLIYIETSKIENLLALAIVCPHDGLMLKNTQLEKQFAKIPFKDFTSLNEAKCWILEIVSNKESEKLKK